MDIVEFIAGQQACHDGFACPANASESFKSGYSAEYEEQQKQDHLTCPEQ